MLRLLFLSFALVEVACASSGTLFPIEFGFQDIPEERRVAVTYSNTLEHTVCLLPEFWPNQAGKINQASGLVFLVVGEERFDIENFNTGYCPTGCALRVGPGEVVRAFIEYQSFGLPESLVREEKRLEFAPKAFRCKPERR